MAVVEDQAPIRAGSTTIDLVDRGEVFTVLNTKESGYLVSRGHAGWIEARQVLPLEEAVERAERRRRPATGRRPGACRSARIWLETDHPDEAIAEASEAIRLSPELVSAWLIRSAAHRAKKDFAAALIDAQSAVQLAPQSPYGHMAIGDIWRDQHRSEQAIAEYLAAVTLDRKNCELRLRLAQARLASFDPAEWITAGQEFTTDDRPGRVRPGLPASGPPGTRRSGRQRKADSAIALEEFDELIAEKSDDVPRIDRPRNGPGGTASLRARGSRSERGRGARPQGRALPGRAGRHQDASNSIFAGRLHDLDEAAKLDPKSSEAYFVRGKVLAKQKKWAPAIAAFSEAIALDANNAPAYLARSEAYQAKGEAELAKSRSAQVSG